MFQAKNKECDRRERARASCSSGFTLIEVLVAAFLAGIMFTALFGGFSMAFRGIQLDRENSRATQIMLEKTELIRLYNWAQITGSDTNTYPPTSFSSPFYPDNRDGGFDYNGTVSISAFPFAPGYANDLRAITITLNWTSGNASRTRSMTTWVSKYGLQNYLY